MSELGTMLNTQRLFQERYALNGKRFETMTTRQIVDYIKEYSIHLNQEINEMLYELPFFKPWKDYSGLAPEELDTKLVAARKEYIDAWHFMLNLALALGFTEKELFDEYMKKHAINNKRQEEGY